MDSKRYTSASLETAACLWEAVLEILNGGAGQKGLRAQANRCREQMGTSTLRLMVIGWTEAVDADWARVRVALWDRPFDWEWIPEWLALNVDWSGREPYLRVNRIVPGEAA